MNNAIKGLLKAIIIVGLGFIIIYFVSYNKWLKNDFDKVDITYGGTNQNNNDKKEEIDKKDLYQKINYEFLEYNLGSDFYNIYYEDGELTSEYFIFVGIINIIDKEMVVNCNLSKEIKATDIETKIRELFGNVKYSNKSFTNSDSTVSIKYDNTSDKYYVTTNKCSGFDFKDGGIKNIYYKAFIEGDFLYIYEKSLYLNYTFDSNSNIIFNYHEGLNEKSKIISNNIDKIDLDKLRTYKYKFIKENDKYTLESISK